MESSRPLLLPLTISIQLMESKAVQRFASRVKLRTWTDAQPHGASVLLDAVVPQAVESIFQKLQRY